MTSRRLPEWLPWSALAFVVAVAGSAQRSLWQDEAITAGLANGPWSGLVDGVVADRGNMSAFYLLQRLAAPVGAGEWWLRLPSALGLALTIAFSWSVARRLQGRWTAHVLAALLLTSVAMVYYGQEARSYALTATSATALTWLLERRLRQPTRRGWLVLGLAAGASLYLHVVMLFFMPGLFAVAWVRSGRKQRLNVVGAAAIAATFSAPLAIGIALGGDDQVDWLPPLGAESLARIATGLSGAHFLDEGTALAGVLFLLVASLAVVGLVAVLRQLRGSVAGSQETMNVLLVGFFLPVVLMLAASVFSPLTSARYYLHLVPGLLLLSAVGLQALMSRAQRAEKAPVGWLVLVLVLGLGASRVASTYTTEDVPWRELSEHIDDLAQDGDVVHSALYYERAPFDFYHWRSGETELVGLEPRTEVGVPQHPYPDDVVVPVIFDASRVFVIEAEGDTEAVERIRDLLNADLTVERVDQFGSATVTLLTVGT